jgi:two-component system, NtrC family, sensor kinase
MAPLSHSPLRPVGSRRTTSGATRLPGAGRIFAPAADCLAVLSAFSHAAATPATIEPALDRLCRAVPLLVDGEWAAVWLHDRRARTLSLATPATHPGRQAHPNIATSDAQSPLVAAMRHREPAFSSGRHDPGFPQPALLVPLRGRRRALGVLVAGLREGSDRARALAVGRQLQEGVSTTIENVQLLDDVLRSRRELENVFDSLPDLVAVTDPGGRIVHVNRAFADRLGVLPRSLVDAPLTARVGEALSAWISAQAARRAGVPARTTVADERLGAVLDVTLHALPPHAGHVLVGRDVTGEHARAADRRDLEQRLARSEKLLALGQFVGGVAHELNNPLQGVLGHLELLRTQVALPAAVKRDLTLVYRDADRAARIVRNLLLFAGTGRLEKRAVSLTAVVERVLRLRAVFHRRTGIVVTRSFADTELRVAGDAVLLHQAVLNLVLNAEQAMEGGGTLAVRVAMSRRAPVVVVEDTGPGLTDEVRARLFEPFFTTKDVGAGTGLGLAMVFGITQAHGARVEAANRPAGGAQFTITFPATAVAPKRSAGARRSGRPRRSAS